MKRRKGSVLCWIMVFFLFYGSIAINPGEEFVVPAEAGNPKERWKGAGIAVASLIVADALFGGCVSRKGPRPQTYPTGAPAPAGGTVMGPEVGVGPGDPRFAPPSNPYSAGSKEAKAYDSSYRQNAFRLWRQAEERRIKNAAGSGAADAAGRAW